MDELGFTYNVLNKAWEGSYKELVKFHRMYKHFNIPSNQEQYSKLYGWVKLQRKRHRVGKLEEDRVRRLNALNFQWDVYEDRDELWERQYNELIK